MRLYLQTKILKQNKNSKINEKKWFHQLRNISSDGRAPIRNKDTKELDKIHV